MISNNAKKIFHYMTILSTPYLFFSYFMLINPQLTWAKKNAHQRSTTNKASKDALSLMQKKYENVKTLTAEFEQTQKNLSLGRTKNSKGRIYIMRPSLFRWETLSPDPSILTTNGHKMWFYTPPFREGERGQVMVRAAADAQSKLAVDLMVGNINLTKTFQYTPLEDLHYQLTPLTPAGDVKTIELFLENQTNLVYKIKLATKTGNETTIILKNVELGAPLQPSMFNFQVPPNTEVTQ